MIFCLCWIRDTQASSCDMLLTWQVKPTAGSPQSCVVLVETHRLDEPWDTQMMNCDELLGSPHITYEVRSFREGYSGCLFARFRILL